MSGGAAGGLARADRRGASAGSGLCVALLCAMCCARLLVAEGVADTNGVDGVAEFRFEGVVHADRADIESLLPWCPDLVVAWRSEHGRRVERGAPILLFDTSIIRRKAMELEQEMRVQRATAEQESLSLRAQLEELRDRRDVLLGDLAVTEAEIRRVGRVDPLQAGLLKAEWDGVRLRQADAERELALKQALYDGGELSEVELTEARLACARVGGEVSVAELRWKEALSRVDSLAVTLLELKRMNLRMELGQEWRGTGLVSVATGGAGEKRGIEKRIEALEREKAEKEKNSALALARVEKNLHEAVRNAYEHTPVNFVEIAAGTNEFTLRRVVFRAGPVGAPAGYEVDTGAVFEAGCGYGWNTDLVARAVTRETGAPVERGAVLVRGLADWRCELPRGSYRVRIGLGDEKDWHHAMVRVREADGGWRLLAHEPHLKKRVVVEAGVEVGDAGLLLRFGDGFGKSIRAPRDGVALLQPWAEVGMTVWWNDWPVAFLADADKFKIKATVHQDQIPLLRKKADGGAGVGASIGESESAALRALRVRQGVAASRVEVSGANGLRATGEVVDIGTAAVRLDRAGLRWQADAGENRREFVAREVLLGLAPEQARLFRLGEVVDCSVRVSSVPGALGLPVDLVIQRGTRTFVRTESGAELAVHGFRVGSFFFVSDGVSVTQRLVRPLGVESDSGPSGRRFPGRVIAGERVQVALPAYWGRIREMVPDGAYVTNGQALISLYNPDLDANRDKLEDQKAKARQEFIVAAETRRVKSLEAMRRHDEKLVAERRARTAIRKAEERDRIVVAQADAEWAAARVVAEWRRGRLARLRALAGTSRAELAAEQVAAELAEGQLERARLRQVAALRQQDMMATHAARADWLDAVDALGFRDQELQLVRREESVSRTVGKLRLDSAMEGGYGERTFERIRNIKANGTGRLFYQKGWNDQTLAVTKIGKDFVVWGGMTIAEILDMGKLAMEVEVPEELYREIRQGCELLVGFDQYPGVVVTGLVARVGKSFATPQDVRDESHGEQAAQLRRVFTAEVRYSPPRSLAEELVPDTRGSAWLAGGE